MPSVVITGAAGGIGTATCNVFLDAGYKVIGVDRRKTTGRAYEMITFDISGLGCKDESCLKFFEHIKDLVNGRLDVLINNAAIQIFKPIDQINNEDWIETLNTNLLAPFWLIQSLLPLLRNAKGSVVNIASIHAKVTKSKFTLYTTSKGALMSLTRTLALELAPDVRVNAVVPAATDTPMLRAGFENDPEGFKALGEYHPMQRIARPEEVGHVALFLASPQASFITGSAYSIDGGIGACLPDPAKK